MGESKRPLYFIVVAAIVNIFMDIFLVVVIPLEAAGTAIATVLSQAGSFVASFWFMYKHKEQFDFELKLSYFKINRSDAWVLTKLAIPQVVRSMMVRLSMMWVNANLNAYGLTVSATNSIGTKIQKFLEVFVQGVDTAAAAMVGQNLGAKLYDRASKTIWVTFICCETLASVCCMNEIDNFSTASLITRSTNDVTQIQNFMSKGLQHMVKAPFMVVWALIKIAGGYWQWKLVTIIAVVIMTIMIVFLITYAHPRLRKRQYYTDNLSRDLRENLTGIRVIRAYNAEKYQEAKFTADDKILTDNERKAHHGMSLMRPEISLVNNLMMVGIYVIGAYLIAAADTGSRLLIFSDMVVYSSYAAILIQAFMDMNMNAESNML